MSRASQFSQVVQSASGRIRSRETRIRRGGLAIRSALLREDDLTARSLLVELADADDLVDLRNEVVDGQAEHVDGRLAGVEAGSGVGDELDELWDRRDVDLL